MITCVLYRQTNGYSYGLREGFIPGIRIADKKGRQTVKCVPLVMNEARAKQVAQSMKDEYHHEDRR